MKVTCTRCGASFDAKTARRAYCDACRRAKRIEKAKAAEGAQNSALLEERSRRNLTVVEMAEWLGIHTATYYQLEHNGTKPGKDLRRRIAGKLGVPEDKLFGTLLYDRVCRSCGQSYQTDNEKSRICPCCEERRRQSAPPVHRKPPRQSVQEIAAAARKAGMSYGKYVAWKERGAV